MTEGIAESLRTLAERVGVATAYHDWVGNFNAVDRATVVAVLAVTRHTCRHRRRLCGSASGTGPPVLVAAASDHCRHPFRGRDGVFRVHVTHGAPANVWIRFEDGTTRAGIRQADNFTRSTSTGALSARPPSSCPAISLGYHRLHLRSDDDEFDTLLIVTPAWPRGCPPEWARDGLGG